VAGLPLAVARKRSQGCFHGTPCLSSLLY
jgi:hypothetical protein